MKSRSIFWYYLLLAIVLIIGFRSEKKYSMNFTAPEILKIAGVMEASNAPHQQVLEAQQIFYREVKPYTDSTGKLK